MARLFICYRRDDASGHAGRMRDALSSRFGAAEIFRDIEAIAPGEDFVHAMSRAIGSCTVFLAVIGRNWLTAARADGTRRLDDPADHVRGEIAEALRRGVRVIPVLVQDARMPTADLLPEELAGLASRNAIALDDDSWEADVERLAAAIRRALETAAPGDAIPGPAQRQAPGADAGARGSAAWMRRHPIMLVLAVALLVAAVWLPRVQEAPQSPDGGAAETVTRSRPASGGPAQPESRPAPAVPERAVNVTLESGGEAALGQTTIEILEARLVARPPVSTLDLLVRLTNHGRYDALFSASAYRLVLAGQSHAPTTSLSEVVASETSKEAVLSFEVPGPADTGRLQIAGGDERAEIAIDFTGRSGVTPAQDADARRAGRTTFELQVDDAARTLRFGDFTCRLRAATLRRYVNKQTLTLHLDAENRGRYDAPFGDGYFRLLLDGSAIAPVSGLSTVVPAESARSGDLVFDLPLHAQQVTLRGRYGEISATIPLRLPPR